MGVGCSPRANLRGVLYWGGRRPALLPKNLPVVPPAKYPVGCRLDEVGLWPDAVGEPSGLDGRTSLFNAGWENRNLQFQYPFPICSEYESLANNGEGLRFSPAGEAVHLLSVQ